MVAHIAVVGQRACTNGVCMQNLRREDGTIYRCNKPGTHYLRKVGEDGKRSLCATHAASNLAKPGVIADPNDRKAAAASWRQHRADMAARRRR